MDSNNPIDTNTTETQPRPQVQEEEKKGVEPTTTDTTTTTEIKDTTLTPSEDINTSDAPSGKASKEEESNESSKENPTNLKESSSTKESNESEEPKKIKSSELDQSKNESKDESKEEPKEEPSIVSTNPDAKEEANDVSLKKVDSYPTLSHKSSASSISTPKSILRKRRTGDGENSESSTEDTALSKKKHIEFSDDNIVYTLEDRDDYEDEEEEDDEAYKGHRPNYNNDSLLYTIFVYIRRYFLFALVIAAGFCFSYYSYNSKKSHGPNGQGRGHGHGHGPGGRNRKPGPPSIQWNKPILTSKEIKKTSLQRIDSVTMTEVLSADPTSTSSVFQAAGEETQTQRSKEKEKEKETPLEDASVPVPPVPPVPKENSSSVKAESTPAPPPSSSSTSAEKASSYKESLPYRRIIAVGDIHGDYTKLIKVLRTAKIIDKKSNWIAKDTILVQTGDLIDRGSDTILIFDLMIKLKAQAPKKGGLVYMLLGNHELMNLQEDYRYVTRGDVMSFGGMANRRKELSMEGKYGRLLRDEMNATMIVDDTLFVHAGLTSGFAKFGVDQMNSHVHYILQNYPPEQLFYAPIFSNNGPFWTRFMSLGQEGVMCQELEKVLQLMKVNRMVVGHTVQEDGRIHTRCQGKYIMIDVGMSEFYGGAFAYLEIFLEPKEVWAVYSETSREPIP